MQESTSLKNRSIHALPLLKTLEADEVSLYQSKEIQYKTRSKLTMLEFHNVNDSF